MRFVRETYFLIALLAIAFSANSATAGAISSHLTPTDPYPSCCNDYALTVKRALITNDSFALWMIARPWSRTEYAVGLTRVAADSDEVYELRYFEPTTMIWQYRPDSATQRSLLESLPNIEIKSLSVRIADSTALDLMIAWKTILMSTRYDDDEGDYGDDGIDYDFFSHYKWGIYYGSTWSPEKGIAKDAVDLGELLISFVKASPRNHDEIEKKILSLCAKIGR